MKFDALSLCRSEMQISGITEHHVRQLGFDYWLYSAEVTGGGGKSSHWHCHNFPADLWQAYSKLGSGTEHAIAERSRKHVIPRVWVLPDEAKPVSEAKLGDESLHRIARRLGVQGGLCLPIHDLAGVSATLTLGTRQPVTIEALEASANQALLFSKYLHEACRPYALAAHRGSGPDLSPREVECLTWASKGKTAWEIGRVLGISEHTAVFHLRNASTKLGTASRQQAVAKSIHLGFIAA